MCTRTAAMIVVYLEYFITEKVCIILEVSFQTDLVHIELTKVLRISGRKKCGLVQVSLSFNQSNEIKSTAGELRRKRRRRRREESPSPPQLLLYSPAALFTLRIFISVD